MHLYFEMSQTLHDAVASGLFDTIGLFKILSEEQEQIVMRWLRLFDIEKFSEFQLSQLPASQQRLALIARALVKFPPLLILDEPGQGLDPAQLSKLKKLINHICEETGVTLIYISHYKEDIPEVVTKYIELKKGRVVS
jgi:molybdate transport system ATP-binding protein